MQKCQNCSTGFKRQLIVCVFTWWWTGYLSKVLQRMNGQKTAVFPCSILIHLTVQTPRKHLSNIIHLMDNKRFKNSSSANRSKALGIWSKRTITIHSNKSIHLYSPKHLCVFWSLNKGDQCIPLKIFAKPDVWNLNPFHPRLLASSLPLHSVSLPPPADQ